MWKSVASIQPATSSKLGSVALMATICSSSCGGAGGGCTALVAAAAAGALVSGPGSEAARCMNWSLLISSSSRYPRWESVFVKIGR